LAVCLRYPVKGQSSETSFVAMIARRLIDRLRHLNRAPEIEELSVELPDSQRLDRQIEISSEAALAAQALSKLRPEQQRVLKLPIYQGLSHREIANATGLPLGTVKTHARRGLMHIRESLGVRILGVGKEAL
jgi:RNA polymerase sigma factor (sigma-70 family)